METEFLCCKLDSDFYCNTTEYKGIQEVKMGSYSPGTCGEHVANSYTIPQLTHHHTAS
jgi:hypothetical protein